MIYGLTNLTKEKKTTCKMRDYSDGTYLCEFTDGSLSAGYGESRDFPAESLAFSLCRSYRSDGGNGDGEHDEPAVMPAGRARKSEAIIVRRCVAEMTQDDHAEARKGCLLGRSPSALRQDDDELEGEEECRAPPPLGRFAFSQVKGVAAVLSGRAGKGAAK